MLHGDFLLFPTIHQSVLSCYSLVVLSLRNGSFTAGHDMFAWSLSAFSTRARTIGLSFIAVFSASDAVLGYRGAQKP